MANSKELIKTTDLLLEIASILMVSGANTIRINSNIDRFVEVLNYKASCFISHKSIVMTVYTENDLESCTRVKNIPPYAINFSIISAISKLSWEASNENWSLNEIAQAINSIKKSKRYPRIIILLAVSIAGAGFCNIFKGDYINMLIAFISTFTGLFILQTAHQKHFNLYFRIFLASFIASFIASLGVVYDIGANPVAALVTSILFLVPGVPLINSFTDLLDSNIINGLVRFTTGLMIVLAIAMGLFLTLLIFQLN
ncbi:threonine/serine exporter family protein [Gaetbulibacter saemankumensis]|uniref:threonine/serine ThrE exporter family protein n=1 Tax=Gaetbulibacter saemankumensis TaxID=311208 RepID=UPI00068463E9|nr:threonine/serine exporter family protein [Gaetbulibacter saemankumensis]